MSDNNSNSQEKKLYETIVKYKSLKFDTKLKITDKRVILEKKYGFFKKKYKVVDTINIEDIIVDNNKSKIEIDDSIISIEIIDKTVEVTCKNFKEAKKIKNEIIKIKDDSNLLEKVVGKVEKTSKNVGKSIVGTVTAIGGAAYVINKNKKEITKALKTIKEFIKK